MSQVKLPSTPRSKTTWHYAVYKGQRLFYEPACSYRVSLDYVSSTHGLTINRGDVTCSDCMRMMGMPATQ